MSAEEATAKEPREFEIDERSFLAGFFSMEDATALVTQNERLEELNDNIQLLAKAIEARPTRREITTRRYRVQAVTAAAVLIIVFVFINLYHQVQVNRSNCQDRNHNTVAFRGLLKDITDAGSGAAPEVRRKYDEAFTKYLNQVKPINCSR